MLVLVRETQILYILLVNHIPKGHQIPRGHTFVLSPSNVEDKIIPSWKLPNKIHAIYGQ